MTMRTKAVLYGILALIGVPGLILLFNYNNVGYLMDSGEATVSIAQLQSGKPPDTIHLTVTQAVLDRQGSVEYTWRSKKSKKTYYYSALRSSADPSGKAPVVVVSESAPELTHGNQFSGIWTNRGDGFNAQIRTLLEEQGVALTDEPMVVDIDKSRDGILLNLGLWIGGAVLLISLVTGAMFVMLKEPEDPQAAQRRKAEVKPLVDQAGFNAQFAQLLRQAFPNPTEPLSVRATGDVVTINHGDQAYPAPPPVIATLNQLKSLLKKHKVSTMFIYYFLEHDDLRYD
ncbi:MAG: hypothetical protein R3B07_11840 [Polyangiaceae bacterium]